MIEEAYVTSGNESGLTLTWKIWEYHVVSTLLSMENSVVKIMFYSYVQLKKKVLEVYSLGVQLLLKKEKGFTKVNTHTHKQTNKKFVLVNDWRRHRSVL